MKISQKFIISSLLLFLLTAHEIKSKTAHADAINEVMENINDPNHIDSKMKITEEDILNMEMEEDDGEFGIKNIHKRIKALKKRWDRIKNSNLLTEEEKKTVKEHLDDLIKLREKNYDAHEKINSVIAELVGIQRELENRAGGGDL